MRPLQRWLPRPGSKGPFGPGHVDPAPQAWVPLGRQEGLLGSESPALFLLTEPPGRKPCPDSKMTHAESVLRLLGGRELSPVTAGAEKDEEGEEEESGGGGQASPQGNLQVSAQQAPGGPHGGAGGGAGWHAGQSSTPGGIELRAASAAETNLFGTMSAVTRRQHLVRSPPEEGSAESGSGRRALRAGPHPLAVQARVPSPTREGWARPHLHSVCSGGSDHGGPFAGRFLGAFMCSRTQRSLQAHVCLIPDSPGKAHIPWLCKRGSVPRNSPSGKQDGELGWCSRGAVPGHLSAGLGWDSVRCFLHESLP